MSDLIFAENENTLNIYRECIEKKLAGLDGEAIFKHLKDDLAILVKQLAEAQKAAELEKEMYKKQRIRLESIALSELAHILGIIKRNAEKIIMDKIMHSIDAGEDLDELAKEED